MARAICVGMTLLLTGWGVGCGARTELREEADALAGQGGITHGGSAGRAATAGSAGASGGQGGRAASGGQGGRTGAAGMGGVASGSAGSDACSPLIDDLETGTGRLRPCKGRVGSWYAYNDGFAVESPAIMVPGVPILPTPIPGGRGASRWAMFARYDLITPPMGNNPMLNWGAGVGVDLNFDGQRYGSYDASAYDGISFWTRSTGPFLRVRVSTVATTLVSYGGTCKLEFCAPLEAGLYVSADWQQRFVTFKSLGPPTGSPGGARARFQRDQLTNIQFLFTSSDTNTQFWVDDLSFFSGAPPTP